MKEEHKFTMALVAGELPEDLIFNSDGKRS